MVWIDRKVQEPSRHMTIIVWGEDTPGENSLDGVLSCYWDWDEWCECGDQRGVEFKYWFEAPKSPYSD